MRCAGSAEEHSKTYQVLNTPIRSDVIFCPAATLIGFSAGKCILYCVQKLQATVIIRSSSEVAAINLLCTAAASLRENNELGLSVEIIPGLALLSFCGAGWVSAVCKRWWLWKGMNWWAAAFSHKCWNSLHNRDRQAHLVKLWSNKLAPTPRRTYTEWPMKKYEMADPI